MGQDTGGEKIKDRHKKRRTEIKKGEKGKDESSSGRGRM